MNKRFIKVIFINLIIFTIFIVIVELIFGSWIQKNNLYTNLSIARDYTAKFDIQKLYSSKNDYINYSVDENGF